MTTTAKQTRRERIEAHGRNLLAIFPNATEQDPYKLCAKLRRLEAAGQVFALRLCNGPEYSTEDAQDADAEEIMTKVGQLLQFQTVGVPVILNRDPRGYSLKIADEWMREHNATLERDWGGYGIIAPEIT